MEEDVEREELVGGRGRHVTRNEVDVVSTGEHKRFIFIEVNKVLKLWVAENALRGVSFVKGHRTLKCQIDRNGIKDAYSIICDSLKNVAQNHPYPIQYYEHMRDIFDSYVNPDGDPDVHPIVTGLDTDDFSVDKLLGPQELQAPPARRDIDGADFEDDLSKRERIRLQSNIIAMRDVLPPVIRSARTRLDYEAGPSYVPPPADIVEVISVGEDISARAPAEKDAIMDLVLHTGDTPTDAHTGCIADVVNLEEDDGMKSPPPSQMIPCRLCHLDSHTGIHETSKIFHVLKTFVAHTMPIDTNKIVEDIFEIDEQINEYTCGFPVLQLLAGACKKELALDRCYMVERLQSIAKLDHVTSFELMMSSYLEGKLKIVPF
ncbi:hypothetical protein R1sor_001521 [Riccia sorocarpa]|uniref:Uncharacterized protein n=1 Tax=Riccia sorocarpa TaxID=122646 RepID=A0ABD3H048_9MARC